MKNTNTRKIVGIVLTVILVSILLTALSYEFYLDTDYRINKSINTIDEISLVDISDINISNSRKYVIVYDMSDDLSIELKDSIRRTLDILKVDVEEVKIGEVEKVNSSDYIIAALRNWYDNKDTIEVILQAVNKGASMLAANIPYDDKYLKDNKEEFGITEFGEPKIVESFIAKGDIILGLEENEQISTLAVEEYCFEIKISPDAKLYLESEEGIPLYFTTEYGQGMIGFYNGENLTERYLDGLIIGILGTLEGDFIYPIVNTGIVFIDDWPGPLKGYNDEIDREYGMTIDDFIRYVWWPDMVALSKQYGISFVGQYVLSYNDIQQAPFDADDTVFDVVMYSYGKQIMKYNGEFGLHGYNHQPLYFSDYPEDSELGYSKWESKEDGIEALKYAEDSFNQKFPDYRINCYVPPSNIIDETGIEVVKEVMGLPVIISGIYVGEPPLVPEMVVKYEDEVIYLPRFSAGSFLDDEEKLNIVMGMSTYGIVSHFVHPDDILDPARSRGYTWEEMRGEFAKVIEFIDERYPFLDYNTVTEGGNKIVNWYSADYIINYENDKIEIKCLEVLENHSMVLRTDKEIVESEDYEFVKCGEMSYYITFEDEDVTILLTGDN